MMNKQPRVLIKLGGAALDTELTLVAVTEAIHRYRQMGFKVILVHGGGPAINLELRKRNITWEFVGGQRVTTNAMIEVIESTLCGQVNGRLVRHLGAQGLPVAGFSGVDNRTLFCEQASKDLGLVGKITKVNCDWLNDLLSLKTGLVPVIAPVGVGANGQCFNINADMAATHLAVGLEVDHLVFLTDQPGVLDEEGMLIKELDLEGMTNMIDCKVVSGGMLAKTQAVMYALKNGVQSVRVLKALDASKAVTNDTIGTRCVLMSSSASMDSSLEAVQAQPMKEKTYAAV